MLNKCVSIALVQMNLKSGDIDENFRNIRREIEHFKRKGVDIVVFPELSLTGFFVDELILHPDFYESCCSYISKIRELNDGSMIVVVGHPLKVQRRFYNVLSCFQSKKLLARFFKGGVDGISYRRYDHLSRRYNGQHILCINGYKISFLIGEDIFLKKEFFRNKKKKIDILFLVGSFPYSFTNDIVSHEMLRKVSLELCSYTIHLNAVGCQDDLVFEGGSKVFDSRGNVLHLFPSFAERSHLIKIDKMSTTSKNVSAGRPSSISRLYEALVLSVRDYVKKNFFSGIVIGLSGGIDSSLSLSIAVDAVGKEFVKPVMVPSIYTSNQSITDAKKQCELIGLKLEVISIQEVFVDFSKKLGKIFKDLKSVVLENLQARCRLVLLMGISNQIKYLLLSTSNRSELYTGYTTIYGDMSGGFAPLKDIPKTVVFQLSKYRNTVSRIIPESVLYKKPTSELRRDVFDEDDLPNYSSLDSILFHYIDLKSSIQEMFLKLPHLKKEIYDVMDLFHSNEFKRRQSPIGPMVYSRDLSYKRYPVSYRHFSCCFRYCKNN
ncbi:NAD+ synthase [Candidatus Riesia pediculischaeffi]|uniref:Glutamine-dependent NAD(+) synthetase n=1 Tax=Candidatus Riesia pediculischaeffi PTSU TaxID=1401651 RepID=A0A0C1V5P1_9ENTR|nr:NAD+ synthase [Candidatus Riesia pediculischaeffi]KIE63739.1 NAD synthetase [Candidatus Riesia pediculischaeffi PTSU]